MATEPKWSRERGGDSKIDPVLLASEKDPSLRPETMPQLSCPLWERFSRPALTSAKALPLPLNPKIPLISSPSFCALVDGELADRSMPPHQSEFRLVNPTVSRPKAEKSHGQGYQTRHFFACIWCRVHSDVSGSDDGVLKRNAIFI
jgi:hypothetical protein